MTLGGIPATTTLTEATGFAATDVLSLPLTSVMVQVTAQDVDGNTIIGKGAPTPSAKTSIPRSFKVAQIGATSTFSLTPLQAPTSSTMRLTATETPTAASGAPAIAAGTTVTLTPVTEYTTNRLLSNQGGGVTEGPDGNMWFVVPPIGFFYQLLAQSPSTVNAWQQPAQLADIVAGPSDGNMWINGSGGFATFRGSVTTFPDRPAGQLDAGPEGITVGSYGALWYAKCRTNSIARMTIRGVTEYPIPTSSAEPQGIATGGPNGTIWFTEINNQNVGKVTLSQLTSARRASTHQELRSRKDR